MILSLITFVAAGGGIGALLSRFGTCAGACALISTWRRGAISGAVAGCLLYFISGHSGSASMNESTPDVKRIGESQFDAEVTRAGSPVVVDFYATWCGPCRALAPRMDKLAGLYSGRIKFVKVNVDEAQGLAQRYQIQAIPALLFFRNGKLVDSLVGLQGEDVLKSRLTALAEGGAAPAAR